MLPSLLEKMSLGWPEVLDIAELVSSRRSITLEKIDLSSHELNFNLSCHYPSIIPRSLQKVLDFHKSTHPVCINDFLFSLKALVITA